MTADLEPDVPVFRVVRGSPPEDELAALSVLLAAPRAVSPAAPASGSRPLVVRAPWRQRRTWHSLRENATVSHRSVARPPRRSGAVAWGA